MRLRGRVQGRFGALEVADNGLGPEATHEQKPVGLFQRFHDYVEGSGIGLYMVKKTTENVGERTDVCSEFGVGTAFSVCLAR